MNYKFQGDKESIEKRDDRENIEYNEVNENNEDKDETMDVDKGGDIQHDTSNTSNDMSNTNKTHKTGRKPKDPYEQQKQSILLEMKNYIDTKGGLVEIKGITALVEIMKRESLAETRIIPIQILNLTENIEIIKEFMNQQGIFLLTDWVSVYKDQIENHTNQINLEQKDYDLLDQILNLSNKMPIKSKDLKNTKFGKQINKLGKCVKDSKIKGKCEAIVERWKKMISDQKEKSLKSNSDEKTKPNKEESSGHSHTHGHNKESLDKNIDSSPRNSNSHSSYNQNTQHNQHNNQHSSQHNQNIHYSNSSHSTHDYQFINKKREKRDFDQEFDKNNKKYNIKIKLSLISFVYNNMLLFVELIFFINI